MEMTGECEMKLMSKWEASTAAHHHNNHELASFTIILNYFFSDSFIHLWFVSENLYILHAQQLATMTTTTILFKAYTKIKQK